MALNQNIQIRASVGAQPGALNDRSDVEIVQKLLNEQSLRTGASNILANGVVSPQMIDAIKKFQQKVVGIKTPDGRVDPGGATFRALSKSAPVAASSSTNNASVEYKSSLKPGERIVDPYCIDVIKMVMNNAGCSKGVISSTIRTPEEQVDIMYANAKVNLADQYKLYGSNGDAVLKVYEDNRKKSEPEIKKLMVAKVKELLQKNKRVSLHVTTVESYQRRNIIDVGVASTQAAAGATFDKAKITASFGKAERDGYIAQYIDETGKSNNCWHVEIIPNAKPLPR